MAKALIYTRISKDKAGDEHGVANQLAECERYCTGRGWTVTHRLSDNDLSASNGKHRPGYEEALRLVDARAVDVVLCWRLDRFVRRVIDLEGVITRFERAGVKLAAVSGDLDLGTGPGRLVGRMLSVIAQGEVEQKSERQKLAAQAAARAGKRWTACPRPFGYEDDHVTIRPAEAEAIRWGADCLLGGGTVSAVMREWERRGLRPPQAPDRPWRREGVRTILVNPRLAALSAYRGEIVGAGQWEPVLTEATWRAVHAVLTDPARKMPRGIRTLLGGLATCRCGTSVQGNRSHRGYPAYRCAPLYRGERPGPHVAVRADPVDDFVEQVIVARLSLPDVAHLVAPPPDVDTAALRREAAATRRTLDEMAADRAAGLVSRSQLLAATERGNRRLAEISAALAEAAGGGPLSVFGAGEAAEAVWGRLDNTRKRAVIGALATVTLHPAGAGRRRLNPADIVEITPHQPM